MPTPEDIKAIQQMDKKVRDAQKDLTPPYKWDQATGQVQPNAKIAALRGEIYQGDPEVIQNLRAEEHEFSNANLLDQEHRNSI